MIFSTLFTALCASSLVVAAPLRVGRDGNHRGGNGNSNSGNGNGNSNNGNNGGNNVDIQILQFANVLEQLETQFYTQGIAKFQVSDFTNAGFINAQVPVEQLTGIAADEQAHATALASAITALGGQPITTCSFDFSSVLTDVNTMASVARIVENVGVGAYLGAAGLISDPNVLTAAASIVTIEARHQTILNLLNDGTTIPQSFDVALTPNEVVTLAGSFISGCDLGITPNPTLTITNTGSVNVGTLLTFSSDAFNGVDPSTLTCQMLVGGQATALAFPLSSCVVPAGVNGPVYLYVTDSSQPLANNPQERDAGAIVAGPAAAFIDSATAQQIASVVRTPNANAVPNVAATPNAVATTTTISPADATSLASAAATTAAQTPPAAVVTTPAAPPAGPASPLGFTTVPATPTPAATAPANVGAPAPAAATCFPACPIGTTTTTS